MCYKTYFCNIIAYFMDCIVFFNLQPLFLRYGFAFFARSKVVLILQLQIR
jgi:hypothetical protein